MKRRKIMKNKIKNSINKVFAIAFIGLLSFSGAYSFSGNVKVKKSTSKKEIVKKIKDVKVVTVSEDDVNTTNEEILMKELMKKISQDYKTTNITIAIDGFEQERISIDKNEFKGKGEVKIGEVEWNTISFDVVLDEDKNPTKIEYKIQN
jgi:hypothetical protein